MLTSVNKNYLKLTPCPKTRSSFSISQNWNEKGSPALSTALAHQPRHCLQQLPRKGHWVGDSVWRMIEVPACAEHFKYLQRYFKKRSWHVLLLLCLRVQSSTVSQAFACCRMFCSFFGRAAEREVQLQMRHEGCPVAGNKGEEWRGAVRGTVNGLRHLSACVLLGKCQKPLVKKPYGNYSTQLNMKCGKGSAVSPGMRLGGIEGRKLKKVAALGK